MERARCYINVDGTFGRDVILMSKMVTYKIQAFKICIRNTSTSAKTKNINYKSETAAFEDGLKSILTI